MCDCVINEADIDNTCLQCLTLSVCAFMNEIVIKIKRMFLKCRILTVMMNEATYLQYMILSHTYWQGLMCDTATYLLAGVNTFKVDLSFNANLSIIGLNLSGSPSLNPDFHFNAL